MDTHRASMKGSRTVGRLAGTMVAAGAVLFAAPAAIAFADPVGDLGHALNSTANQVNSVVQGNVNGLNKIVQGNVTGGNNIVQGNVTGGNNIVQGNVTGGNNIVQGNVTNTNNIVRGLLGLH